MGHRLWMDTEAHRIITEEELYAEYEQRPEELQHMTFEEYIAWGEEFTLRRLV